MVKDFLSRLKESALSIFPIILMILLFNFVSPDIDLDPGYSSGFGPVVVSFLISVVPLVLGMALFNLGAEKCMGKIGHAAGTMLTKRKSLFLLCFVAVLMGTLTTMAEPDLLVLSLRLFPRGPNWIFVTVVALGVGALLMVAVLRVIFQKPLKNWLVAAYLVVFALGCLSEKSFYSIVFDSSGVTTGPVSVPFIIALGIGVASVRGGKNAEDDAFGYSGLCSLGPLISVMIMGIFISNAGGMSSIANGLPSSVTELMKSLSSFSEIGGFYLGNFLNALEEVALSMAPVILFFVFFRYFLNIKGKEMISVVIGFINTFVGLVLFVTGASSGFIPVATRIGTEFAKANNLPLFLMVGFVTGCLIILAEPAVHVLAEQVNDVSRGAISKKTMYFGLCLATGFSVLLNIIRIQFSIPLIDFVVPIYLLTFALCFFVPDIYVAIAFDSSGVATGTLSSCFLLPLFIGYTTTIYGSSSDLGNEIMQNGFGIIGMVASMPLLAIELIGFIGVTKTKMAYRKALLKVKEADDSQVIHLPVAEDELTTEPRLAEAVNGK